MIRNKKVSQCKLLLKYPDVKRVYDVIITQGKVISHEHFVNM